MFGIRGELDDTWRYDVSYQYSEVDMANLNGNYFDTARLNQALKAELDADGNIVRSAGADAGCVPYNLWTTGGVTDDQVAFLSQEYFESGSTSQEVFMAYAQGSLGNYGIASPLADSGVEVVIGFEYRDETLDYDASDNAKRGTVGGLGAAVNPVSGAYDVNELYIEANVPVIENAAFAQSVVWIWDTGTPTTQLERRLIPTALRGTGQSTTPCGCAADSTAQFVPPISWICSNRFPADCLRWIPILVTKRLLGTRCRFRATPLNSAHAPGSAKRFGTRAVRRITQRRSTTRSAEVLLSWILEEADTYTAGVILTPSFLDGLTVAVDWYDIEVESAITGIAAETTLLQCLETGSDQFCNAVGRGQNDTLWLGFGGAWERYRRALNEHRLLCH